MSCSLVISLKESIFYLPLVTPFKLLHRRKSRATLSVRNTSVTLRVVDVVVPYRKSHNESSGESEITTTYNG